VYWLNSLRIACTAFTRFKSQTRRNIIFKPTIYNEDLQEIINNNGTRAVNIATSKNVIAKNTMFPHRNSRDFTLIYLDGKTIRLTIF
jgi:hypothetical protein